MEDNFKGLDETKSNKTKRFKLSTLIAWILVTNIITASLFIFAPIPFVGGKMLVSRDEYNFAKQFSKMTLVKKILEAKYVDKLDENKFVDGAIRGMVDSIGDPYTSYMDAKEFEAFQTHTQGSYSGLGIYVDDKDGKIVVISPIEGGPAEKAGIKSGDFIIKVEGKDVASKDMEQAVAMMKGKPGTKVKVTLFREGKGSFDLDLTREKIVIKSVKGEMLEDKIGYIRISTFDENTADEFKKALSSLQSQGAKGLVLDLRDNGGGLLDQCAIIADKLLGKGTIVYTIDKNDEREEWNSDENKINIPLVVLVNKGTASASEIVSGAVRDFKAGTIIGTNTFGKGLVQTIVPMVDGTGVKVTIARYYTPSGECIQGKGIKPDIVIENPKAELNRVLTRQEDIQFKKAIEVIKSKM